MHTQTFHSPKRPLLRVWVNGKKKKKSKSCFIISEKIKSRPFHFKGWSHSNFMDGGKSRKLHCLDNSALIVLWPWPIYLNSHLPEMSFWNALWEFSEGWGRGTGRHINPRPFQNEYYLSSWEKRRNTRHPHSVMAWYTPVLFHLWVSKPKMNLIAKWII